MSGENQQLRAEKAEAAADALAKANYALVKARDALVGALAILVYLIDDGHPTEAELHAIKLLDRHAPGWREK